MKALKYYTMSDVIKTINPREKRSRTSKGHGFHVFFDPNSGFRTFPEVLDWIYKNTRPVAFSASPGLGIVIMQYPRSLQAFAIDYRGLPDTSNESIYQWTSISKTRAMETMKNYSWNKQHIDPDYSYKDNRLEDKWECLGYIVIYCSLENERTKTAAVPFVLYKTAGRTLRVQTINGIKIAAVDLYLFMSTVGDMQKNNEVPTMHGILAKESKESKAGDYFFSFERFCQAMSQSFHYEFGSYGTVEDTVIDKIETLASKEGIDLLRATAMTQVLKREERDSMADHGKHSKLVTQSLKHSFRRYRVIIPQKAQKFLKRYTLPVEVVRFDLLELLENDEKNSLRANRLSLPENSHTI